MAQKNGSLETLEETHLAADYKAHRNASKELQQALRESQAKREHSLFASSKHNPKRFYDYLNNRLEEKHTVPDLVVAGNIITTGSAKAQALNAQFASVFTPEDAIRSRQLVLKPRYLPAEPVQEIKQGDVRKLLHGLKPQTSCGGDGIKPIMLKRGAEILSPHLT